MLQKFLNLFAKSKNSIGDVAQYYDQWTDRYLEVGENLIEAYRTKNINELLNYYIQSMGLKDGMHLLDAGCGVCGPAIHFAKHLAVEIDALTISQVQIEIAQKLVAENKLTNQIKLKRGDYHNLSELYPANSFDGVFFLEALGHAQYPSKVILNTLPVLKEGGFLYIKDFFLRETDDKQGKRNIKKVKKNIDKSYAYNTLDLHEILTAARKAGYKIGYIKSPEFSDDIEMRVEFEKRNNIDIFKGVPPFIPNDWLEIKLLKDSSYNHNFHPLLHLKQTTCCFFCN